LEFLYACPSFIGCDGSVIEIVLEEGCLRNLTNLNFIFWVNDFLRVKGLVMLGVQPGEGIVTIGDKLHDIICNQEDSGFITSWGFLKAG